MTTHHLGDVDGQVPDAATIKISGAGWADRALAQGERVSVVVIGVVTGIAFRTKDGALERIHTIKAESMAEAGGDLGDQVEDFLERLDDEREGRTKLPLDEDDDDDPAD